MPYLPFAVLALSLSVLAVLAAWPWLRRRETRDKAAMLCTVGVSLALALYLHLGSPFTVRDIARQQQENLELLARIAELEARHVEDRDALAWAELGAGYMVTERYADAAEALRHAVVASEGDPRLVMAYGKAQMLAADGNITEGARQAFIIAARLMPDNPEPSFLLAVERMQAGDRDGARQRFRELLPRLPEGAPLRHIVESRVAELDGPPH